MRRLIRSTFIPRPRHKILHTLLLGENAEYQDYTLRIVGHSLGAGIGVILSYMLRNTFPTLRCICYSPPGGLLSWELAKECSEFVNSFVLDSDIVPRLSINNMERWVLVAYFPFVLCCPHSLLTCASNLFPQSS